MQFSLNLKLIDHSGGLAQHLACPGVHVECPVVLVSVRRTEPEGALKVPLTQGSACCLFCSESSIGTQPHAFFYDCRWLLLGCSS